GLDDVLGIHRKLVEGDRRFIRSLPKVIEGLLGVHRELAEGKTIVRICFTKALGLSGDKQGIGSCIKHPEGEAGEVESRSSAVASTASSTVAAIVPFISARTAEADSVADALHSAAAFCCSRSSTFSTALSLQPKVTHRSAIDLLLPPLLPATMLSFVACHSVVFSSNTHTLRSSTPRFSSKRCLSCYLPPGPAVCGSLQSPTNCSLPCCFPFFSRVWQPPELCFLPLGPAVCGSLHSPANYSLPCCVPFFSSVWQPPEPGELQLTLLLPLPDELQWMPELRRFAPNVPIVLVGTNLDLREDKRYLADHPGATIITPAQGEELRKQLGAAAYIECSSKTQQNVKVVFDTAIKIHFS
ncbi:hypothetical protein B296_00001715, partial [Ensete ventricosum]